jgi:hypothetical protein
MSAGRDIETLRGRIAQHQRVHLTGWMRDPKSQAQLYARAHASLAAIDVQTGRYRRVSWRLPALDL